MGTAAILTGIIFRDFSPGDVVVSDEGARFEITPIGVIVEYEGITMEFLYVGISNLGKHLLDELQ